MEQSYWHLVEGQEVNKAIAQLPVASEHELFRDDGNTLVNKYKLVTVNGEEVDCPTKDYVLKQHSESFRPVIEGLTLRGIDKFQFSLWNTNKWAALNVFVGEVADGVKFGFSASNSFDRSGAMNYGFLSTKREESVQLVEKEHVLVWGFRQVCSNGMIIKVPLKSHKYLDAELVTKVKTLLADKVRIVHRGANINTKLEAVQYIVEGYLLLKNPISAMIFDAQKKKFGPVEAKAIIAKYVSRRKLDKYLELYGREEQTLWGLYNAVTFLASHEDKISATHRKTLLERAATMLTSELLVN